jgi:hypothetical protein
MRIVHPARINAWSSTWKIKATNRMEWINNIGPVKVGTRLQYQYDDTLCRMSIHHMN